MATWAVSDLHGNYELFLAILDKVSPEDTVKMYGEVDRGFFTTEIDIDYVEKM